MLDMPLTVLANFPPMALKWPHRPAWDMVVLTGICTFTGLPEQANLLHEAVNELKEYYDEVVMNG